MENVRKLISPYPVSEYFTLGCIGVGGLWIVLKIGSKIITKLSQTRMLARWKDTPKDVVIVHRFPAGKVAPNASPFVIKLETFLRMAKIPYEIDEQDYKSVKGKSPWITLNGEHVADSQLCIEFLAKKFGTNIGKYSKEQRAIGTMARITMDEHFYWGLVLWRYIYTEGRECHQFMSLPIPPFVFNQIIRFFTKVLKEAAYLQGIGRHSQADVIQIMCDDLRALSNFLGNKKFLLGDDPCEDDAAVFGELSQIVWCCPNSPYENLVKGELKNLHDYCIRMKETYWPDWDDYLHGGSGKGTHKKNK